MLIHVTERGPRSTQWNTTYSLPDAKHIHNIMLNYSLILEMSYRIRICRRIHAYGFEAAFTSTRYCDNHFALLCIWVEQHSLCEIGPLWRRWVNFPGNWGMPKNRRQTRLYSYLIYKYMFKQIRRATPAGMFPWNDLRNETWTVSYYWKMPSRI